MTPQRAERRVAIPTNLSPDSMHVPAKGAIARLAGPTMGTGWSVQAVLPTGFDPAALQALITRDLDLIIGEMSNWEAGSDINRFNAAPAGSRFALPDAFRHVLTAALRIAEETDGAYDPTLGRLVDRWGFGPAKANAGRPNAEEVAALRERCGWRALGTIEDGTIIQPGGLSLDLSSIAKGYAVDRISASLRRHGVSHFLVEVGGELFGAGVKPGRLPWFVEIEHDAAGSGQSPLMVALHELAIATSGTERAFHAAGRSYSHTIDPRTGEPIDNGMVSASVLHHSCMEADAYSTALMTMGPEKGLRFASDRGLPAILISEDASGRHEWLSPKLAEMLD